MNDASAAHPLRRLRSPRSGAGVDEPLAPPGEGAPSAVAELDTRFLETLLGYNARRAALSVIALFLKRMAPYDLRPVDFSVLTLIAHNPGVTSRQLCVALDILPPNLVGLIKSLDQRGLIERRPHPTDRRAQGLHLSATGRQLQAEAQRAATQLESEVAPALSAEERGTLIQLLSKVYRR
jgi:DNA-binding MarR family transcriptional regulator